MADPAVVQSIDRPLQGKRILVTRARNQASSLANLLAERGAHPVVLPTIEVGPPDDWGPVDRAIAALSTYQWTIFTSANGVRFFADRLAINHVDVGQLRATRLAAVGPATAAALSELGLTVDFVPTTAVAEAIVAELATVDLVGKRILFPRARDARDVLADGLRHQGASVDDIVVYQTNPVDDPTMATRLLTAEAIDIVTFTSSSTVRNLAVVLGEQTLAVLGGVTIASIGPITSQTIRELGLRVDVEASEHTITGLVSALERHRWE